MKRLLLLSLSAGMIALIFSSYATGPFAGGAGNRTGSAGTTASCSDGTINCHATNSGTTTSSLVVQTTAGMTVTQYAPGTTYKVLVQGGTSGTVLPRFGFQASCVKATAPSTQAGTFTAGTNMHVQNTGGSGSLQLVEHGTPLSGTVVSGNTTYLATFTWTAPAKGTGSVEFFAMLNAVNNNNSRSGDQPGLPSTNTLTEDLTAGIAVVKPLHLSCYPNPVSDILHIRLDNLTGACNARIFSFTGVKVKWLDLLVINGEASVNTATLPAGNYYLLVQQGNQQYATSFAKQ